MPTTTTTAPSLDKVTATCDRLVAALTETTGIEFKLGYIGNCDSTFDNRSWYAFAAHPGRVGTSDDSIGGVSTANLADLIPVLRGALQMARIAKAAR